MNRSASRGNVAHFQQFTQLRVVIRLAMWLPLLGIAATGCSHTQAIASKPSPRPTPSYDITIYRVTDIGKPGQPRLTPKQAAWVARILRTPYYRHRLAQLSYLDDSFDPAPPLGVFLGDRNGGAQIVDHEAYNWPCNGSYNPREHDFVANTPGCESEALPSPVK